MNKSYCQGGSHKMAGALAREFVRNGGSILDSSQVNKISMQNGAVGGVELWEGRTLHSKVVISSLDPHTTFLDLVGDGESAGRPEGFGQRLGRRQVELQHAPRRHGGSTQVRLRRPVGRSSPS